MLSFRRHVLPLFLILLMTPPPAQADIVFNTTDISPALWPWPAAVAPEPWIFSFQGVVWADHASVRYSFTEGSTVYEETVLGAANVGPISATSDNGGDIHACFQAQVGAYGLRYAHRSLDGTWDSEWVVTGTEQGWSSAIGFLQGIGPVIAYVDATVPHARILRYSWRNVLGWTSVDLDAAIPGDPLLTGVTLATDGQDAVHVAWTTFEQVRYSPGPGPGFEVVTSGSSVSSLSVGIGKDDQPRLAILDSGALYYAVRSPTGWTVVPVLPERQSVREMSMAIGYEGIPHIVFVTDNPEEPVFFATEFLGSWREQPLTEVPTYGIIQRPSLAAASGTMPSLHLVVAWNGGTLKLSADVPSLPAFAVTRLRAAPLGELVSTIDLYSTTQYRMDGWPLILDFTAPGVMDTVNFCYTYRDTLRRWTDNNGTATFQMATGGAVTGGIAIRAPNGGFSNTVVVERSVPMAGVDLEGNGSVTPVDRELLRDLMGTDDPRGDLDFSGLVDETDLQILLDYLGHDCTVSSVGPGGDELASTAGGPRLTLHPNPASDQTTVSWRLPAASRVRVTVYDLAGRRVRDLVEKNAAAGEMSVVWDGRDHGGRPVSGGVYLVRM